ncbi:MAG: ABC transporter ATP-binding protein [Trebonia sp.]
MTATVSLPESTAGAAVVVDGLIKRYASGRGQVTALDDISVQIKAGEAVALMGPSGSGKSTLLHLIGAMDTPTSGSIRVGDRAVEQLRGSDAADYRRQLGFVFQGFHLLGALSALDNVLAPTFPTGRAKASEPRAQGLLAQVGLGNRGAALPSELSGGEQQRVAIARALIAAPALLLADEPTGNLDSTTGMAVIDLLLSLRADLGTTLLLATHSEQVADRLDRTVRLADGKIT